MIYRKLRTHVCAIAGRTSLNAEDRCSSGGENLRGNEFVPCQSSGPVHPTTGRRSWREAQGRALGRARRLRTSLAQQRPSVAVGAPRCRCARQAPRAAASSPPGAARARAVSSRCWAAAGRTGLGKRGDQVAATRTSELPLPKTGPQDRCVGSRPLSCCSLRSG